MTKLEIQAIQKLPARYVRDHTNVVTYSESKPLVIAWNHALPVIYYVPKTCRWRRMKFVKADT